MTKSKDGGPNDAGGLGNPAIDDDSPIAVRKASRQRKQPAWMTSGDYVRLPGTSTNRTIQKGEIRFVAKDV